MRNWLKPFLLLIVAGAVWGQPETGRPGNFDYYLLTLSWVPEYCYAHRDAVECNADSHYGFIVHGLWPQFFNGRYPEHCSTEPAPDNPASLRNIMPDPGLIRHEWTTHGTCSGLRPEQYFSLIRRSFEAIRIPPVLVSPNRSFTMAPSEIKQAFEQVNPKIGDGSIAVNCPQNFLHGIQICVSKSGTPIDCPANATRDCRARSIRIPPVR